MIFKKTIPTHNDTRVIKKFTWLPRKINRGDHVLTVWLETVQIKQKYHDNSCVGGSRSRWVLVKTYLKTEEIPDGGPF